MDNKFETTLEEAARWVREHQERFWAIVGTSVLAILFISLLIRHRQTENQEGWMQLGAPQSMITQGRFEDARKSLDSWDKRFRGTSGSTYAKFLRADLLYRTSDYVQANQIYAELSQTGSPAPTRPLAIAGEIAAQEMSGHIREAQDLARNFLDKYPDHFLTAQTYMTQARLVELSGNPAAAAAIYERVLLLYPNSPWTALAKSRTQTLGKK